MASQEPKKVPKNLQLAALLSCGLTIAASVVYVVLSILALLYRNNCDDEEYGIEPKHLFIRGLLRVYIQADSCDTYETPEGLTAADSVFILVILTLVTSIMSVIAASVFIAFVNIEHELLHAAGYVYVAMYACALTVDLTLASHLGMDYSLLTERMNTLSTLETAYPTDILRLGALLLMTIALKGFVLHVVNITLIILIIVYLQQYKEILNKNQHPIHNLGVLDAYDAPRKEWEQRRDMYNAAFAGGTQGNQRYIDDDYAPSRNPPRENQRNDFQPSRAYEHSDSWQHSSNNQSNIGSNRPFTYLEEPQRPKAPSPSVEPPWRTPKPTTPSVEPPWRGNWSNPPPVPAPDYSPQPRRLKSALKPGYM